MGRAVSDAEMCDFMCVLSVGMIWPWPHDAGPDKSLVDPLMRPLVAPASATVPLDYNRGCQGYPGKSAEFCKGFPDT